jgi:two-component system, NarL family, nitrate/nitrite response regulator NarL
MSAGRPGEGGSDEVRVLIVDDHSLFIDAIRPIVEDLGGSEVAVATSGAAAIDLARANAPDLALVDIGLPDRSGLSVAAEILSMFPDATVVALTGLEDVSLAREAAKIGLKGYLSKDVSLDQFRSSLRNILRGGSVQLLPGVGSARARSDAAPKNTARMLSSHLTKRELEVLRLLVQGDSGGDIADALGISKNTVRTHIQSILTKLQVHSRLEAVAFATRNGITQA